MPSISVNPSNNYFGMAAAMSSFFFFVSTLSSCAFVCLLTPTSSIIHLSTNQSN